MRMMISVGRIIGAILGVCIWEWGGYNLMSIVGLSCLGCALLCVARVMTIILNESQNDGFTYFNENSSKDNNNNNHKIENNNNDSITNTNTNKNTNTQQTQNKYVIDTNYNNNNDSQWEFES